MNRTIELHPDEMRALGYRVVDTIVEHLSGLPDRPVARMSTRAELETRLREPPPEQGRAWSDVLDRVRRDVLGPMTPVTHPRFFAYVPSPGNFVGAMADALVSGLNPFAGAWVTASGAAEVELVTVDWLRQLCGLPAGAGGAFVSGGSMANLTALAVARHQRLGDDFGRAVVYCSDQAHSSVQRGARVLGFRADQVRTLASDDAYRLPPDALAAAVDQDRAAGRTPFCVVASAGTTNTGAVDPLADIARICRARGLWLHVDGAYGAAAAITPAGAALLEGMGDADSITLDPHKWLFQPFECGCVLVRQAVHLKDAFRLVPEYLRDSDLSTEEVNFRDWGVQLTRDFKALKLWMTVQVFGMEAIRAAVDWGIHLAEAAERELRAMEGWEIATPAQLGIVTFRHVARGMGDGGTDDHQRAIAAALLRDGYAMLSTTELRGRAVLRLCTINPRTTEDDVRGTVRHLDGIARGVRTEGGR
ncbi:MAG TPA: aminotransferase class V-fold PLP-dependent enzyme [Longimicrobium sp.]|nr:aminotransferase class V-fold PLP-dependent enzyme [Longimicrobium sp.]